MEVKTFTYKKILGTFYRQGMLSNQKMDDHIAEMLGNGWEMLAVPGVTAGNGRTFGLGVKHDKLTITFKKG